MPEPKVNELMEKIVSLCKRRGFIFQSSEIYGGINGFWDYGPLGAELKRNVKEMWWRSMVRNRDDIVGLDATIIMHPQIWKASGHVDTFSDPMCDCLLTKKRFRADQIEPQDGDVYHYKGAWNGRLFALASRAGITDGKTALEWFRQPMAHDKVIESLLQHADPSIRDAAAKERERLRTDYRCDVPFAVLIPEGKHKGYADQIATQFYSQRGINSPVLDDGPVERGVKNTTHYNPENGALLTEARAFNLMFKTFVGPVESDENVAYLRPETAQAIFAQFKNVLETSRQKVAFGIAQVGKAFRNEITPRNFTFRSREFEQMELEFFIRPDEAVAAHTGSVATPAGNGHPGDPQPNWGWQLWHKYWVEERIRFYESIGLPRTSLEEYWQKPEELAHYAKATVDILYRFPFGTQELEGIAARGDFDLSQHQKFSGKSMEYFDDEIRNVWGKLEEKTKQALQQEFVERKQQALLKKGASTTDAAAEAESEARNFFAKLGKGNYIPHVIEPSAGVDRLVLALICNAYTEDQAPDEKGKMETRVVMRFHPRIAPIKVAVFPLLKNRPELVQKARHVCDQLRPHMAVFYDDAGAIGRRYRRQDEAGTPFGVTIDFDTLGENGPDLKDTVTLRDRDTMRQTRVNVQELLPLLLERIR
jgi:glycyl-tRNA synthetase